MIKETVYIKEKKTSLTITNSKISAVLRSDIEKTGIRLYDNNCLGIAGAIGAYNENELIGNAKQMLKFKLPYNATPTQNAKRTLDLSNKLTITDTQFVEISKQLLETLSTKYPQFMFSNKINFVETEERLSNDVGTELIQKDKYFDFSILIKHRDSKSLMDGGGSARSRNIDFDTLFKALSWNCDAYETKADFSEAGETIPVITLGGNTSFHQFTTKFLTDLRGDVFANNASLFSNKLGEKLFSDKFTLSVNRNTESTFNRFFDGEGTTLPNDRVALIENGVIKSPYASKKVAQKYNLQITGSASLEYDSAPDSSAYGISVEQSDKTLKELLGGKKGILVVAAGGGDFTPQGEYASPIQIAYLFDGENFLGRLPQLAMTSNVNDMFGKNFVGASTDGDYPGSPYNFMVVNMNVKKIDTWL